jgi:hypothetical protein
MREPAGPGVATTTPSAETKEKKAMEPRHFSVSLTVKDIKASKAFYEKPESAYFLQGKSMTLLSSS